MVVVLLKVLLIALVVKEVSRVRAVAQYAVGVLYALDQLVNRITFGKADHTISGRCGYWSLRGNKFARVLELLIDSFFYWQESHCRASIEFDEVEMYYGKVYQKFAIPRCLKISVGLVEYFGIAYFVCTYCVPF